MLARSSALWLLSLLLFTGVGLAQTGGTRFDIRGPDGEPVEEAVLFFTRGERMQDALLNLDLGEPLLDSRLRWSARAGPRSFGAGKTTVVACAHLYSDVDKRRTTDGHRARWVAKPIVIDGVKDAGKLIRIDLREASVLVLEEGPGLRRVAGQPPGVEILSVSPERAADPLREPKVLNAGSERLVHQDGRVLVFGFEPGDRVELRLRRGDWCSAPSMVRAGEGEVRVTLDPLPFRLPEFVEVELRDTLGNDLALDHACGVLFGADATMLLDDPLVISRGATSLVRGLDVAPSTYIASFLGEGGLRSELLIESGRFGWRRLALEPDQDRYRVVFEEPGALQVHLVDAPVRKVHARVRWKGTSVLAAAGLLDRDGQLVLERFQPGSYELDLVFPADGRVPVLERGASRPANRQNGLTFVTRAFEIRPGETTSETIEVPPLRPALFRLVGETLPKQVSLRRAGLEIDTLDRLVRGAVLKGELTAGSLRVANFGPVPDLPYVLDCGPWFDPVEFESLAGSLELTPRPRLVLELRDLTPGGPWEYAGFQEGDIIVGSEGERFPGLAAVKGLETALTSDFCTLLFERDGEVHELELERLPAKGELGARLVPR